MALAILLILIAVVDMPPARSLHDCFQPGRRIVFLGDSITYAGDYVAWLDQSVAQTLPYAPEILDLGLPSETVSGLSEEGHAGGRFPRPDLHDRLLRLLEVAHPDLVVACYGMNCGIYQPLAPERMEAYQKGIERLIADVHQSGALLILVTPPPFDGQVAASKKPVVYPEYDSVLTAYSLWLTHQKDPRVLGTIDLHHEMSVALADQRNSDPSFTYQPDAVHPNASGHRAIAAALLKGFNSMLAVENEDSKLSFAIAPEGTPDPKVVKRMHLLRDAYLTHIGHKRPGIAKGLPLDEARQKANSLSIDNP